MPSPRLGTAVRAGGIVAPGRSGRRPRRRRRWRRAARWWRGSARRLGGPAPARRRCRPRRRPTELPAAGAARGSDSAAGQQRWREATERFDGRQSGNRTAHLPGRGWAVSDGEEPSSTPPTLPRGCCMVARTERSPGFGPSLAFPVSQWRHERSAGLEGAVPVTVAGPRRYCTGFRASPFACSFVQQRSVYRLSAPAARAASSGLKPRRPAYHATPADARPRPA